MQRKSKPLAWRAHGLSDTEDASSTFNGAMASLQNLIPDPQSAKIWYCRPAATLIIDFNSQCQSFLSTYGSAVFSSAGFISVFEVLGDVAYGMMAGGKGFDIPFIYNLQTNALNLPTGVTATNLPLSPPTSGAWIPPQLALIGAKLVLTHQGFTGLAGNYFGWFDVTNPMAPTWNAGNLTGSLMFTAVPTAVAQFNQRAYYVTNVTAQPAVFFSDVLNATNCTLANQILTFGDNAQLTALAGLPLFNQLGGVVQSLMVFKDETNVYQVTGDSLTNNLAINSLNLATGTRAAASIATTPKGLAFISPEGLRVIDFTAKISDPIGFDGDGVTSPFSQTVEPTRISGGCNGSLYRVTTQNGAVVGAPIQEFWYDVTRQIFSGPHSSVSSDIVPWRGTFIIAPLWHRGALFRSDPIQSDVSSFTENGNQLAWTWQTPLLPDTDQMVNVCMTESNLDLAFAPGGTVSTQFEDQAGNVIDTVALSGMGSSTLWGAFNWGTGIWGGTSNPLAPIRVAWHQPIVFPRGSFQASGLSAQQVRVGALHLRYQEIGQWAETLTYPQAIAIPFVQEDALFPTKVLAQAANISTALTAILTLGYTTVGDGGGAQYLRVNSNPGLGGFQSADGSWWQLVNIGVVTVEQFGAIGDGTTDNATAFSNASTFLNAGTGGNILLFAKPYGVKSQVVPANNVGILGVNSADDILNIAPITSIKALSGFPNSTAVVSFPSNWCGRFENAVVDGNNISSCGMLYTSCRKGTTRNILVKKLTNFASTDFGVKLTSAGTLVCASNYFDQVTVEQYDIAVGTNALVFAGAVGREITGNTFVGCSFQANTTSSSTANAFTASGSSVTGGCDNNYFIGCGFVGYAQTGAYVVQLLTGTNEFRFFGTVFLNTNGSSGQVFNVVGQNNLAGFGSHTVHRRDLIRGGVVTEWQSVDKVWLVINGTTFNDTVFQGTQGPTPGASPWTYTNANPYSIQFWITSGTITGLSLTRYGGSGAITLPTTSNGMILAPYDTLVVTYTGGAPGVSVQPLGGG